MASEAMKLCDNGKRGYTRGWKGSRWVKRQTAKKSRRASRAAIRTNEGDVLKAPTKGWVW